MVADPSKQQVTALPPFSGIRVTMTPLTSTAVTNPMCLAVSFAPAGPFYVPKVSADLWQLFAPNLFIGVGKDVFGQWVASMNIFTPFLTSDTWNGPTSGPPDGTYTAALSCTIPVTILVELV